MNTELTTNQPVEKRYSLIPQTLDQAIEMATRYSKSGMVPKHYENKPDAILVAWDYGGSLGLGMMQSLQSICVINGNPSIWGDALLALVMTSGLLENIDESIEGQCTVTRKGKKPVTTKFSMADAVKAKLTSKSGPWTDYPKRMLQLRNRAFALRDVFPDVIKGMKIAEEVQDYVDPFPGAIEATATPTPTKSLAEAIESSKQAEAPQTTTDPLTGEIIDNSAQDEPETPEERLTRLKMEILDMQDRKMSDENRVKLNNMIDSNFNVKPGNIETWHAALLKMQA